VEAKFIGNLSSIHGVRQILFVSKDEKKSITELILVQHPLKFFPSLGNTISIIRVDDKDNALSVLEVF
jgi:hypothetical protein